MYSVSHNLRTKGNGKTYVILCKGIIKYLPNVAQIKTKDNICQI